MAIEKIDQPGFRPQPGLRISVRTSPAAAGSQGMVSSRPHLHGGATVDVRKLT